jgi:hypothetical protein
VSSACLKSHFPPSFAPSSLFGTRPGVVTTITFSLVFFTPRNRPSCALCSRYWIHSTSGYTAITSPSPSLIVTSSNLTPRILTARFHAVATNYRLSSCRRLLFRCLEHLYSIARLATLTFRCTYSPTAAFPIPPFVTAFSEVYKQYFIITYTLLCWRAYSKILSIKRQWTLEQTRMGTRSLRQRFTRFCPHSPTRVSPTLIPLTQH